MPKTAEEWMQDAPPAPPAVEVPAAPAPDPVTPPVETPAPTTPAEVKQGIEMLEALLDEAGKERLKVPATARFGVKVDGKEGFATAKDLLKAYQTDATQTQRFMALAEQRRAYERDQRALELDRAAYQERQAVLQAEVDRYRAAQGDPDAMERLAADQDRLRSDPEYKKMHDDALEHRLSLATQRRDEELSQFEQSQSIADEGAAYITRVAAQYPGVDPVDIRSAIALQLRSGDMTVGPAEGQFNARTVDRFFQEAQARLDRATAPHLAELDGLRKRLEALELERKNGKVVAGLRTPRAPATGAPAAPQSPAPGHGLPAPVPGETLSDRGSRWAKLP